MRSLQLFENVIQDGGEGDGATDESTDRADRKEMEEKERRTYKRKGTASPSIETKKMDLVAL